MFHIHRPNQSGEDPISPGSNTILQYRKKVVCDMHGNNSKPCTYTKQWLLHVDVDHFIRKIMFRGACVTVPNRLRSELYFLCSARKPGRLWETSTFNFPLWHLKHMLKRVVGRHGSCSITDMHQPMHSRIHLIEHFDWYSPSYDYLCVHRLLVP